MLFNSYEFIFLFLPVTVAGFFVVGRRIGRSSALLWLAAASLFFYGWWNPRYVGLILVSMIVNYFVGCSLVTPSGSGDKVVPVLERHSIRKVQLLLGIAFNLGLLGYFKYANFFLGTIDQLFRTTWQVETIVLPLGISFFTFQQIAYLVDAYRGTSPKTGFVEYCLFVTFFPQLIAGPIIHHDDVLPQLHSDRVLTFRLENLVVGLTFFTIGLFKKVVLADMLATWASPVFQAANIGGTLTFLEAWGGALAYSLQLYFDFSGYSDMAIGLGRIFGVQIAQNFNSPYKARNIADFWNRWHITLSLFLRDYLYVPLGGNRNGTMRRYLNLMVTMLLSGLWHGAGWNFVLWGGLHGFYYVVSDAWRLVCTRLGVGLSPKSWWNHTLSQGITWMAVVGGWVLFRTSSLHAASNMLKAMAGRNGISLPVSLATLAPQFQDALAPWRVTFNGLGAVGGRGLLYTALLLGVVWLLPNTQEIMARYHPDFDREHSPTAWQWQMTWPWAIVMAVAAVWTVLKLGHVTEFLYFQF